MTAYKTVFDVTHAGWQTWPGVLLGLGFVVVGFFLLLSKSIAGERRMKTGFALFFICFALFWTASAGWFTYGEYREVHRAIDEGRVKFAEGTVERFVPMPVTGHAMESFCIGAACFTYSDYVVTTGFNNTASHGGPIHQGLKARITFVGIDHGVKLRNIIVKVEVEDKKNENPVTGKEAKP